MLDLKQIESFYPDNLKLFKKNLLREYLQYKILEIIFDSEFAEKLVFMGRTAIRILHSNNRFSEDLDFDNLGLKRAEFEELSKIIQKKLELQGYNVELKSVVKKGFRSYIRITDILFQNKLTQHKDEKLLIQFDAQPQKFDYKPDKVIINKFDVFLRINVVPIDILLAQKIYCIFNRKRMMGRDFYDAVYLFAKTKPSFDYLNNKLKIKDGNSLKEKLLAVCKKFDFKHLAQDVKPFLFVPSDSKKVLYFYDYIKSLEM